MDLNIGDFNLAGLAKINVILGKNGCGKSYLLKAVDQRLRPGPDWGAVRYISPERGGTLRYEPNVDQNLAHNPDYLTQMRRRNRAEQFREQSATLFRRLELLTLREIEALDGQAARPTFETTIASLNTLLDRVRIERDNVKAFRIADKQTGNEASPDDISSGESELISLGIEFLAFVKECKGNNNILLVDEPDVHLHPDLQDRLARFILDAVADANLTLILATHSTALLAGLAEGGAANVAFMRRGDTELTFKPVTDIDRAILPIFGAHPLSNVFNNAPILLIEGEDDERIWQQAVRSAGGRVRVYPCVAESVDQLAPYEAEVNNIVEAVYDDAKAFSLRDRDQNPELIDDIGNIVRMRLSCRAAENLMLTNDCLGLVGIEWDDLKAKIDTWVNSNPAHQYHADMRQFVEGGYDRKGHDLKTIRNILIGLMSNKPWEVLVGQGIAKVVRDGTGGGEGTLRDYLGEKVCREILKIN